MKIPISVVQPLQEVRERIGAPLTSGDLIVTLERLERGTIDVSLSEIEVGPSGALLVNGVRVLAHIQDTGQPKELLLHTPEKSRRVHLVQCTKLDEMREIGRFDRYVATRRTDGRFHVHWRERDGKHGGTWARLEPCRLCLKQIGHLSGARTFSFEEFLSNDRGPGFTRNPVVRDTDGRSSEYTKDWREVSMHLRKQANWRCESCRAALAPYQRLLHVHHVDGIKSNNRRSNLRVLCKLCHSEQGGHNHIVVTPGEAATIQAARPR